MSTRLFTRPNLVRPVFSQTFRTRPPFGPKRPFSSTNPARSYIGRRILWIAPLAGGIALYLVPHETSPIPALLSSPTIIPCHSKSPLVIESPAEPQQSIRSRIKSLICDWIIEPVLTARRFIFLVIIFMPVILSSPMLLVGRPQKQLEGDRWAAVWWYKFLVRQMARAGPTFIKVCHQLSFACSFLTTMYSWLNGPAQERTCSLHSCVKDLVSSIPVVILILSDIPSASSRVYSRSPLMSCSRSSVTNPLAWVLLHRFVDQVLHSATPGLINY